MLVPHVLGASISAVGCFYIAQQALGFHSAGLALKGYWDSEFVVEVLPLRLAGLRADGSAAPTMVCMSASVEMIEVRGLAGLKSSGRKGVLAFKESQLQTQRSGLGGITSLSRPPYPCKQAFLSERVSDNGTWYGYAVVGLHQNDTHTQLQLCRTLIIAPSKLL